MAVTASGFSRSGVKDSEQFGLMIESNSTRLHSTPLLQSNIHLTGHVRHGTGEANLVIIVVAWY